MKLKYCVMFSVILIVLFSLSAVAASENVTTESSIEDSQVSENVNATDQLYEDMQDSSIGEDVDLSVNATVKNTFKGKEYNRLGFEIPWTVTVTVDGGTAHNAKVQENFVGGLEYVSFNVTMGEYSPETHIWDIGDLTSSHNATLIILTKVIKEGDFDFTAEATTDSNDVNPSNNFVYLPTNSGTSKFGSNETETSDDRANELHSDHQGSMGNSGFVEKTTDNVSDGKTDSNTFNSNNTGNDGSNNDINSNEVYPTNESDSGGPELNEQPSTSKSIDPFSLSDSIMSFFNENVSNSSNSVSKDIGAFIPFDDYAKVPILIFILFLIILAGIAGYEKFKS